MVLAGMVLVLAACGQPAQPAVTPFLPPTMPAPTETAAPAELPPQPSPLPICQDNLTFIADITIPDGSSVAAKSILDKRWQVENSGTCNWDRNYQFKLTGGGDLGATSILALYPARSHSQAILRILFTAPADPGSYRSSWQAFGPDRKPFGDPVFIDIIVQ